MIFIAWLNGAAYYLPGGTLNFIFDLYCNRDFTIYQLSADLFFVSFRCTSCRYMLWSVGLLLLLKPVSEPSLKMRSSKLSLRQKVMQKNSRLIRRREVYGKHVPATGLYTQHDLENSADQCIIGICCRLVSSETMPLIPTRESHTGLNLTTTLAIYPLHLRCDLVPLLCSDKLNKFVLYFYLVYTCVVRVLFKYFIRNFLHVHVHKVLLLKLLLII